MIKDKVQKIKTLFWYLYNDLPAFINRIVAQNEELKVNAEEIRIQNEELRIQNEELRIQNEELRIQNEELRSQAFELYNELNGSIVTLQNELHDLGTGLDNIVNSENVISDKLTSMSDLMSVLDYYNPELSMPLITDSKIKILVIGFYGAYNLGDELMLQALLSHIKRADTSITIMLSENDDYSSYENGAVEIIHYSRTISDFSHLATKYDVLIIGGGALLDDRSYKQFYKHFLSLSTIVAELPLYFSAKGKPVLAFGLSANFEFKNQEYVNTLKKSISVASFFGVRDSYSKELLCSQGIDEDIVHVMDDLILTDAFWLSYDKKVADNLALHIAITWVNFPTLSEQLLELIKSICNCIKDVKISLLPVYDYNSADTLYFKQVCSNIPRDILEHVIIQDYPGTLQNTVRFYESIDVAINVRYHPALICACMGVPQIGLILKDHPHYRFKMHWIKDHFSESIGLFDTDTDSRLIVDELFKKKPFRQFKGIDSNRVKNNIDMMTNLIDRVYQ